MRADGRPDEAGGVRAASGRRDGGGRIRWEAEEAVAAAVAAEESTIGLGCPDGTILRESKPGRPYLSLGAAGALAGDGGVGEEAAGAAARLGRR